MVKKLLAQGKGKEEEKPTDAPDVDSKNRKSSVIQDAKWSLMPAETDGKASLMPSNIKWSMMPTDAKPSLMPGDAKPSLMPGDAKPSLMPGDAKPSLMPGDAKPSLTPGDIRPSLMPKDAKASLKPSDGKASLMPSSDAKASLRPSNAKASSMPSDAKASLMPSDAKASLRPSNAKASLLPSDAKTSLKPSDAKASLLPSDAKTSLKPSDAKASLMPSDAKTSLTPSGAKPSLKPTDAKPSLTPTDAKKSLTPKDPNMLTDAEQSLLESDAIPRLMPGEGGKLRKPGNETDFSLKRGSGESEGGAGGDDGSDPNEALKKSIRLQSMIPKDKDAWLDYLVALVKRKINIEYLSEKELRKVISRARPKLAREKPEIVFDPDAPLCLTWTVEEMADWIEAMGFPYLKEAFLCSQISGRSIILVDATALNRMGIRDLEEVRKITAKIRELLNIPYPNMLRALMRIPPFERFLEKKVRLGAEIDALNFEPFCAKEGFIYSLLKNNKNAQIPCTAEVRILPVGVLDDDEDSTIDDGDDVSLLNAPSVEYVVRNLAVRDATVAYIIELLLENVFLPNHLRQYGRLSETWKCTLDNEIGKMCPDERLHFACEVAKGLMMELEHTAEVLSDINLLQRYIKEEIAPDHFEWLRACAAEFMENVVPIASLLALGELDLETIFRQEPELNAFVDDIVTDANTKIQEMGYPGLEVDGGGFYSEGYQGQDQYGGGGGLLDEVIDGAVEWSEDNRNFNQGQYPQNQRQTSDDAFDELFK